jgi:hypothetical protein
MAAQLLEAWTRKDLMASGDEVLITSASFIVMRALLKTKSQYLMEKAGYSV